jgi:Zn-dependent protease
MNNITNIIFVLFALFFSLSFHESAHAYIAYISGDKREELKKRISLNPIVHIDPVGTILIPLLLILFSPGFVVFGWAKPVLINPMNFYNRKKGQFLTSVAGPASNILLIIATIILSRIVIFLNLDYPAVKLLLTNFIVINVILGLFNLLPIPPLDGSGILKYFLDEKFEYYFYKYQFVGIILLLLLINSRFFRIILNYPIVIFLYFSGMI